MGGNGVIFVVPVGNSDSDNVALASVDLLDGPAILGQGANLSIEIRNFGTTARAALPLTVWVPLPSQMRDVPAMLTVMSPSAK